jgi:hypothetical protein
MFDNLGKGMCVKKTIVMKLKHPFSKTLLYGVALSEQVFVCMILAVFMDLCAL